MKAMILTTAAALIIAGATHASAFAGFPSYLRTKRALDASKTPEATHSPAPAAPRTEKQRTEAVKIAITRAIETGAPLYNAGNVAGCVAAYESAARELMKSGDTRDLHRALLVEALVDGTKDSDRAWLIRRAFDRIHADLAFKPIQEASMPEGFPKAGPVGTVRVKEYPRYRAARASDGRSSFWMLFRHIKKNDVKMTAPVEMTMDESMRQKNMAFLYESPTQGRSGADGAVKVLDLEPVKVLSIGIRGRRTADEMKRARSLLEAALVGSGYERSGDFRVMGYNSPMVPGARQYWEVQIPVVATSR